MARTDFTTFISTANYQSETNGNPLLVGAKLGLGPSTMVGATAGLFGALCSISGNSAEKHFRFDNASQLVGALNAGLSGSETTFNEIFRAQYNGVTGPSRAAYELGAALTVLSYGANLVVFGSYEGARDYQADATNEPLEAFVIEEQNTAVDSLTPSTNNVILGVTSGVTGFAAASVAPTGAYSAIGLLLEAPEFQDVFFFHGSLSGADFSVAQNLLPGSSDWSTIRRSPGLDGVSGTYYDFNDDSTAYRLDQDELERIFCVIGKKTTIYQVSQNFGYTDNAVAIEGLGAYDAVGAMARAKARNELFYSIAGVDRSQLLNCYSYTPTFVLNSGAIPTLRENRVNFYSPNTATGTIYLSSDLVGTTGAIDAEDRIGLAYLKRQIDADVTSIGERYTFQINNAALRSNYTNAVETYLQNYLNVIDPLYTQVICNDTNNTDGASTLNMTVIVRPLQSSTDVVVNVSLTA